MQTSVITLFWDHADLLSLWEQNVEKLAADELIWVDNGSQPDDARRLRVFAEAHGILLLRNETNLGFAAANNQGAARAGGSRLLFLNNDVIVHQPITGIFRNRHEDPYALVGPGPMTSELGTHYLEGWCLDMHTDVFDALQGFSTEYGYGYWEDVDFCYRAQQEGFALAPLTTHGHLLRHIRSVTGHDGRLDQPRLHAQNRAHMAKKFGLPVIR